MGFWAVLQLGGLFTPGLLDDVDSVYLQIAREMLHLHDYVTPTIAGIRFFDKPPLMYWLAAASMRVFGEHDWAGRLPLALGMLALTGSVYALGLELGRRTHTPAAAERGAFYAALAIITAVGPYLYTRFYIPDMLVTLWMTVGVHALLVALRRVDEGRSAQLASVCFGAALALNVLTKGLIGFVFPFGFAVLYLAWSRQLGKLRKLSLVAGTAAFLAIALPWHVLAALRNPPVAMPAGVGLPARAGWAWFYLYNEHVARFLGQRIPHDYGQVPRLLFWLLLVLWLAPWAAFLPAAVANAVQALRLRAAAVDSTTARVTLLWAGLILGFFTVSSRQEYYHLPALPALALLTGALLAAAENSAALGAVQAQVRFAARWLLTPLATLLAAVCLWFALTAPAPRPGSTLTQVLSANPAMYNLSLGHVFDLTSAAMGFFRGPLLLTAAGMLTLGAIALLVRARSAYAANLCIAGGMTAVLLAAHAGLVRFYPTLGSKGIADIIDAHPALDQPGVPLIIDGELTSGSSLLFYTRNSVLLVDGRVNGPWFGSFWPDAPHIFITQHELPKVWRARAPALLMTYHPEQRVPMLCAAGTSVYALGSSGDKTLLSNTPVGSSQELCAQAR